MLSHTNYNAGIVGGGVLLIQDAAMGLLQDSVRETHGEVSPGIKMDKSPHKIC